MFNLWYINSAFRLFVAFAFAIPSMVSLSVAGEPGGDAESARLAIQESDEYAWKLFLWINRQGQSGIAGQADPSKASVLEYDEDKDVVWENWALASRDGQSEAEVFLANGAQPGTWAELPRGKPVSKALDRNRTNAHRLLSRNQMFSRGELAPQFVIQEPESDEVRMNQSTFEFVRDNTLYNRQGLAANFAAAIAAKNRDAIQFPSSAKEVKARWDKIDASQKSRYHWRTIGSDVYGLRAFHIITKDLPMWFWTDFIHVDLEVAEPDPCHDATTRGSSAAHGHDGIRNETVGSKWQNYRLKGSQVTFTDSRGVPTILGNQLIEFGNAKVSSCITCHAGAGVASDGSPNFFPFIVGLPPTTIFGSGDAIAILQMDFLYSIVTRAQSLPTTAPIAGKVASTGEMRRIVEGFPAHVAARLAMRKQSHLSAIAASHGALTPQFVLHTLKRWDIGSNVNVAFRGGTTDLHRKIADATKDWTDVGNIKLDFGFNAQTGRYRTWSPTDTSYKAAIRISFDKTGYWSNVARDSIDPAIAGPS